MRSLSTALFILFIFTLKSLGQSPAQRQTAKPAGSTPAPFGFYEYLPADYTSKPNESFPLVLFLHGMGELGNGASDLPKVLNNGLPRMVQHENKDFPFILLSPQAFKEWYYITPTMDQFIEYAKSHYRVDVSRIYVTGLSMGGAGTWYYAQDYPQKVAAIVPICGGGQTWNACKIKDMPIWAFHNSGDPVVGIHYTNDMINALKACGGNPKVTIYNSNAHDAWTATYNDQNMWDWFLSQRKGGVQPPANKPPSVNAGSDKFINLPASNLTLAASGSDSDGNITSYEWRKVSGPNVSMTNTNMQNLSLSNLQTGTCVFKVTVTDNNGAKASDEVQVTINSLPTVNAGSDKLIHLPANSLTLSATATDAGGSIFSYSWEKLSGPAATMTNVNTANLSLSSLVSGTYVFKITVKDNHDASATDEVTVVVNAPPTTNAGADKILHLPSNSLILSGTAKDSDGLISSYSWTKVSGPAATLTNAGTVSLSLSALVSGTYVFRLSVNDNRGASATDDVQVVVNTLPNVTAGKDQNITLPANTAALKAVGTDADGSIASYLWEKVSGPSCLLSSSNKAAANLSQLVAGSYKFKVTVKDNRGASASDDVVVNVSPINCSALNLKASISASKPTTFCKGEKITLTIAEDFDFYAWSTGDTTKSIVVDSTQTVTGVGRYKNGCISQEAEFNATFVQGIAKPQVGITGNDTLCKGEEATLIASTGYDRYLWSDGSTGREIKVNKEGAYTVTAFNNSGCSSVSDQIVITVLEKPAQPTITFLSTDSLVSSVAGAAYHWFLNGKLLDTNSRKIIITSRQGAYTLQIKNGNCTSELSRPFSSSALSKEGRPKADIKIYPNPVSDNFIKVRVSSVFTNELKLELFNSQGKLILMKDLKVKDTAVTDELRLDNYPKGIYFVRIKVADQVYTERIIKL